MKLSDIIELAKQGYKPADIKELLELEGKSEPTPDPTPDPIPEPTPNPIPEIREQDYKKLYEDTLEELKKAQADNIRQPIQTDNNQTDEDILRDLIRNY